MLIHEESLSWFYCMRQLLNIDGVLKIVGCIYEGIRAILDLVRPKLFYFVFDRLLLHYALKQVKVLID